MRTLSPLAKAYIWSMLGLGLVVFLGNGVYLPSTAEDRLVFIALTVAAATAQAFPVVTPKNQAYELTPIFVFAAALLLPVDLLVSLVVLTFIPEWIRARKPWYIQLFNIATCLVQAVIARTLFLTVAPLLAGLPWGLASLMAGLLAAGFYTAVNHLLLAIVLRLARGHSWRDTRLFELEYFLTDATLASTGIIAAMLWQVNPWLTLLIASPLYLIYRALNTPNLQEEARTDPKTDLYNAKHFNRVLQEEHRRAVRFDRPLALIMCDLDLLRNINNRYGHIAGDVVIREVAAIIKHGLREYDVAARFGGEEFLVMLPETDTGQAVVVAERLRRQVEEAGFIVTTSVEPIKATLSLGVAAFPADGGTPEEVVHQADLAVYHAKLQGRNRVCASSPESRILGITVLGRAGLAATIQPAYPDQPSPPRGPAAAGEEEGDPASEGGSKAATNPTASLRRWLPRGLAALGEQARTRPAEHDLPRPLALFVAAVVLAALGAWVAAGPWDARLDWQGLAALAVLTVGAQSLAIDIYGRGRISTSAIILMAGGMIFGIPGALLLSPLVPLTVWVRNRGRLHRALFDFGGITLSSVAATAVYHALATRLPGSEPAVLATPSALAALAYYVVNVGLISAAIGLSEGRSPFEVWNEKFRWLPLHYMVFGPIALLIAFAYQATGLYGLLSLFMPVVMLRYAMKQYIDRTEDNVAELRRVNEQLVKTHQEAVDALQELRSTYDATLLALSTALDSRDSETEGHCREVVEHAAAIARQFGLPEEEISMLLSGALLHDVGKIGVPDAILNKRGPLSEEEWETMKRHPELGYRMLEPISFLKDALPIVRYHHERYDGGGYPERLRGEQIPLGARIFAVADAFHAMTSNRPYRTALSLEEARREIEVCAGKQFDPAIVEAFLQLDLDGLNGGNGAVPRSEAEETEEWEIRPSPAGSPRRLQLAVAAAARRASPAIPS